MPPGTPFNAFALPYRIRVDEFTQLPPQVQQPALHLLTHTHTDHVNGLASKSFASIVYCSRDAKEMLLRHEVYMERELYKMQLKAEKTRTYSHLKIAPVTHPDGSQNYNGSRDLLVRAVLSFRRCCH
jgi:DNA cross-link repair 1C protein